MKGMEYDPGANTISFLRDGASTLVIPTSIPVLLLPTEFNLINYNAIFANVPKSTVYVWTIVADSNSLAGQWGVTEVARVSITATPQEWSNTIVLGDAPADSDIFTAQIKLLRTVSPTNGWPSGIAKLVPENVWIPLTGSLMVEGAFGFARAISVYVDNTIGSPTYRKLVLFLQQSVTTSPGGYGTYGVDGLVQNQDTSGGRTMGSGIPVYYGGDAAPQYKASAYVQDYGVFPFPPDWTPRHRPYDGSNLASASDPTNHSSTWQISVRGQFGRRS